MTSTSDSELNTAQKTEEEPTEVELESSPPDHHVDCIDINDFPWYPVFRTLCGAFTEEGHAVRIVGGAVRDITLKKEPKDIDLCTTAAPGEMVVILHKHDINYRETGIQHGTVTVCKKGFNFEMTSLRVDYLERGERFCRYGTSFKEDANRRDLTINAMSLDVEGRLYDYFQGLQHLKEGTLRFTDSALKRVCEDPLRILRYFRFASCSELFTVDCPEEYEATFFEKRSALADPSIVKGERIWKEFGKTLASPKCCEALDQMKKCKILRSLGFPVLEQSFRDLIDPTFTAEGLIPDTKAAVILGIIFKGRSEMLHQLVTKWRVSNKVKEVSRVAAELSGDSNICVDEIKKYLYSLNPKIFEEEKNIRIQALKSDKFCRLTKSQVIELEKFERPTFPFTRDHFAKVPKFKTRQKDATEMIKEAWIRSCFTMEIAEMVDMVRKMADHQENVREQMNTLKSYTKQLLPN